jgi:hypothetical protein
MVSIIFKFIKTPAPEWFTKEFGTDEIAAYLNDATGDADFWRNFAVMLRVLRVFAKRG